MVFRLSTIVLRILLLEANQKLAKIKVVVKENKNVKKKNKAACLLLHHHMFCY